MKNFMQVEQVASYLEKFNLYKEQEQLIIEDIISIFDELKYIYHSNNSKKIDNLNTELSYKLKTISNIHNNNSIVIEKSINKYDIFDKKAKKILEDIEIR